MGVYMRFICCLLFVVSAGDPARGENWTRFRGPNGQGVSSEKNLPVSWSNQKNVAWKTAIPGSGWSSPIVYEDRVFLTSAMEEGESCRVICVHRTDGSIAWNTEVHRQIPGAKRQKNSYATSTPVTDGQRVYAVFYDGTIVAVDFNGRLVWKSTEVKHYSIHGLGASPILAAGQIIMPFDGSSRTDAQLGFKVPWPNAVVLSLDAETGEVRWKGTRGESRVGHVTPVLIEDGTRLISSGGDRVQCFDVKTGQRIWSVYSQGEGVTPSPVVAGDMIFTSSGFEEPTIRAIRLGGHGDVTDSHIVWEQKRGVPVLPSPLYVDALLYTITRDNILHCIDAGSGDVVWVRRLEGSYSASPVYADGRIYILSEEGVTLVLRPGRQYDEQTRNLLDDECLASMAVSQGHFYIRSAQFLYSIGPAADR